MIPMFDPISIVAFERAEWINGDMAITSQLIVSHKREQIINTHSIIKSNIAIKQLAVEIIDF